MMSNKWTATKFMMAVKGEGSAPKFIPVAAIARGNLAIDKRENYAGYPRKRGKGWCISHIPTGYAVRHLICSEKLVKQIADELIAIADWDFTNLDEAKTRGMAVKSVMDRYPDAFVSVGDIGTPVEVFTHPEERA